MHVLVNPAAHLNLRPVRQAVEIPLQARVAAVQRHADHHTMLCV
jgi:hypothetical protein